MVVLTAEADKNERVNASVDRMNENMRRKLSLLYEMYSLSASAYNYIGEESVEPLNNIFDSKQLLILEADSLDKQFLEDFETMKTDLGISSLAEFQRGNYPGLRELRMNTDEILDILGKLQAIDANVKNGIARLRDNVADDLTRIRRQKQISGAYADDPSRQGRDDRVEIKASPSFDRKY